MIFSRKNILSCLEKGNLNISPFDESCLKEASYSLSSNESIDLAAGEHRVITTQEKIHLSSSLCGMLFARGSIARKGIDPLMTDCFVEPGFAGSLKLSIVNNSKESVHIEAGEPLVKIVFSHIE